MDALIRSLPEHDQKAIFDGMLRDVTHKFLQNSHGAVEDGQQLMKNAGIVSGVAAMVAGLVHSNTVLEKHVEDWLTSTNGEYAGLGLDARRAVITTLATSQSRSFMLFGTKSSLTYGRKAGTSSGKVDQKFRKQAPNPTRCYASARG